MNARHALLTGTVMAGLAVCIGAFGAHGLRELLARFDRADTFELAVKYQFYHSFALLITGLLLRGHDSAALRYAASCFVGGIALFSGSLYVLSLTNEKILGAVTPFGGLLFIAGWALLFAGLYRRI